ncbi:MAG: glutathione transferase GstA [Burkholderiales bacterium]|nr:glutathione transferase GstA [Burkholderiales bacterium]
MKLYYSPGACSLSPHIVLREAGLAFEPVMAPTKTHKLVDGTDYYTINPLGYVPLLELDDGTRLREGPAIVQYIADQVPDRNLAPAAGTLPRYRLQEWLTYIGTEIHKTFSPLFNPAMPEEAKQIFRDRLANRFAFVDQQLAGKDYLMGNHFSVADAYLYTVTRWTKPLAIDLSPFPHLRAHHARVEARPAVQEALKAEKLS